MKIPAEVELAEKKTELEGLTRNLEKKEQGFEELNRTLEQFQRRYSSGVAQKQLELNRLNAELDELMLKKDPYAHDVKQNVSEVATPEEWQANTFKGVNEAKRQKPFTLTESKEAKRVYRKIASIIHPDKAIEERSRPLRTKLMAQLNEAYARKDTTGMQLILDQWEQSPEALEGEDTSAELMRTQRAIAQIKSRLSEIETEIARILSSDVYLLMVNIREGAVAGRDVIAEMSIDLDARIQYAKNKLLLKRYG